MRSKIIIESKLGVLNQTLIDLETKPPTETYGTKKYFTEFEEYKINIKAAEQIRLEINTLEWVLGDD